MAVTMKTGLLVLDAVKSGRSVPTFQRNCCMRVHPDNGSCRYSVSNSIRQKSSTVEEFSHGRLGTQRYGKQRTGPLWHSAGSKSSSTSAVLPHRWFFNTASEREYFTSKQSPCSHCPKRLQPRV